MALIGSRSATSSSVPDLSASTPPTSVGSAELPDDDLPTIQFTSIQDLFDAINCTTGDSLVVTRISLHHFTEVERETEKQHRKFRFRQYNSERQILRITIPTQLHEELHVWLYQRFVAKVVVTGKMESWRTFGAPTHQAQGHPGGSSGQGDSSGGPLPDRGDGISWPTLVIEAGVSESLTGLRNDMRWWFSASNHQVKIVLLVKFEGTRHTITLEKWEEEALNTRPGATTTRRAATLQPVHRQTITITRDTTTDPVSYNVTRGALVLGFRLLFLRDPGVGEGDFVLSVQELEAYAKRVWAVQVL